ncbi:twin-arginine translocation signal domain-containing protein [Pelagibacterium lentulum]
MEIITRRGFLAAGAAAPCATPSMCRQ